MIDASRAPGTPEGLRRRSRSLARTPDFVGRLAAACPKGIDVYFENVGGAVFEAVFPILNPFARIPVCGLISMYNVTSVSPGPILLPHLMGLSI